MTGADFISWFGETSLAVSILIFLILAVRRTVARRFGPDAAYLLWLAPLIRLATPELSIIPAAWRQAKGDLSLVRDRRPHPVPERLHAHARGADRRAARDRGLTEHLFPDP